MRHLMTPLAVSLLLGSAASVSAADPTGFPSALPPVSNPGECYAQVKIPAQYSQGSQEVVTADGYAKLDVTQPQFERRDETVMTKEPSVRYVVTQPSYRSVTDRILTRPGHDRLTVSAPQFSNVTETLQTSAPHLVWKRGNPGELRRQGYVIHSTADGRLRSASGYRGGSYAPTQSGGDSCGPGCEIWCLVEEPGTSVTTTRRVMSEPSRITRIPVAPEYRTITKQVVASPGSVREVPIPAEYSTITVSDLVRPAEAYEVNVPEQVGRIATKDLVSPERYEWRRVVCRPGSGSGSVAGHVTGSTSMYRPATSYSGASHSRTSSYGYGTSSTATSSVSSDWTLGAEEPRYSTRSYYGETSGATHTESSSATNPPKTPPSRTGYYGTEAYPAYQRRVPHRKRRQ